MIDDWIENINAVGRLSPSPGGDHADEEQAHVDDLDDVAAAEDVASQSSCGQNLVHNAVHEDADELPFKMI